MTSEEESFDFGSLLSLGGVLCNVYCGIASLGFVVANWGVTGFLIVIFLCPVLPLVPIYAAFSYGRWDLLLLGILGSIAMAVGASVPPIRLSSTQLKPRPEPQPKRSATAQLARHPSSAPEATLNKIFCEIKNLFGLAFKVGAGICIIILGVIMVAALGPDLKAPTPLKNESSDKGANQYSSASKNPSKSQRESKSISRAQLSPNVRLPEKAWIPPANSFTVGSESAEVARIQGKPDRIDPSPETWWYGSSSVILENGRVKSYADLDRNLKAYLRR